MNTYRKIGSQVLEMSVLGDRIRKRLDAIGEPADSGGQSWLARIVGMKQQGIASIIAGDVERPRKLREIAAALKTSQEYLLGETNDPTPPPEDAPRFLSVPLISWVAAGDPTTPEAVHEIEDAERLTVVALDPRGDWIALRVRGSSMDRISPPDSIIFVNRKDKKLVPNACYVIADAETGEASYKRFRPPNRFEPVSTDMAKHKKSIFIGSPRVIGRVKRSLIDM
jgi:SOS-response transcriptional repressor LexA